MTDEIDRIEQADGPRRELFEEAGKLLMPDRQGRNENGLRWSRYIDLLDAEAWTSAAEMLVPVGSTGLVSVNQGYARIENGNGKYYSSDAAHPSLALLAAILRAERNEPWRLK